MEIVVVVETTASGLLFSYFFSITMAADAIAAAVDVETITVSGLYAFFSYVAAVVTAAVH